MKNQIIRTIYLYMFALLGLTLLTIAGVRFIDMGLKAYVFTKADNQEKIHFRQPPLSISKDRLEEIESGEETLSEKEITQVRNLIKDYEEWQKEVDQIDPVTSGRHRDASINLSMILIGLPLYLYHWGVIRRETSKK